MKAIIFFVLAIVFSVNVYAQCEDYNQYLQSAKKMFDSGNYKGARSNLTIYRKMTNENAESELARKIDVCNGYLLTAEKAMKTKDYNAAITAYLQILRINPNDPNIPNYILACRQTMSLSLKEPIYAKKFDIYKNGSQLSENVVRELLANTPSYKRYNAGLNLGI